MTQLANISYFLSLFFCCSEICLQLLSSLCFCSFLYTYPLKASLENSGSSAKVASSSTKWIMSAKSGSLECLLLIFMTFLFHFSLVFPGNYDSTKHIISGVSRTFQFCPNLALSHFSRKL